jgi:ParB family chromosome partitioning protein
LAKVGQIVPVILRKNGTGYKIVAGKGRVAELRQLSGVTVVRALVYDEMSDDEAAEVGLITNVQRENPMDQAHQIAILQEEGMTQEEIAERVGKSQGWVSQHVRLLTKLVQPFQEKLLVGDIAFGTARHLCQLPENVQYQLLDEHGNVTQDAAKAAKKKFRAGRVKRQVKKRGQVLVESKASGLYIAGDKMEQVNAGEVVRIEQDGKVYELRLTNG